MDDGAARTAAVLAGEEVRNLAVAAGEEQRNEAVRAGVEVRTQDTVKSREDTRAAAQAQEAAAILRTHGQREINSRWEWTQAIIAIMVAASTLTVCVFLIVTGKSDAAAWLAALQLLSNAFFFVIGTYFQRTNHVKTGGVEKDDAGR